MWTILFLLILLILMVAWGYQFVALVSLWRFFAGAAAAPRLADPPGITVLKPLRGLEANTRQCLESFLIQDYCRFQVIFGVLPDDPVIPLLRELQQSHPGTETEIVVCRQLLGPNPKINKLCQMAPRARYDLLVVSDADVKVSPDFLTRVAVAFQDPEVGMVSCPYRGGPAQSLGAKLEALSIAADFIPSVAVLHCVQGIRFGLGQAMALRRRGLEAIGGFEPLAAFLADDYKLGVRVAAAGFQVRLLPLVVETQDPAIIGLKDYLAHQIRWTRIYRAYRPNTYLAYGATHALVYSLALVVATGMASWALELTAVTLILRTTLVVFSERLCLRGHLGWKDFLLLPIKDILSFGLWASSFMGDKVIWGNHRYRVTREGKMVAL